MSVSAWDKGRYPSRNLKLCPARVIWSIGRGHTDIAFRAYSLTTTIQSKPKTSSSTHTDLMADPGRPMFVKENTRLRDGEAFTGTSKTRANSRDQQMVIRRFQKDPSNFSAIGTYNANAARNIRRFAATSRLSAVR
jgi:hypothetical protein